ncbi:MAG: NADAR family protein [Flavobacteriales bacterium]
MKYTIEQIQNTGKPVKFLFFWGHKPSLDGQITKSCFSQWWPSPFMVDGIHYKTAEHYMMAEKARLFNNEGIRQQIIHCHSPAEAKKLGRQVTNFDQDVWLEHRFNIVIKGNLNKFEQNSGLKQFLIQTKKRVLVEASPIDAIWGIGMASDNQKIHDPRKWRGLNLLGFALMEVRDLLKTY